ncbi:MAG TPA: cytochrome c [Terriglobales bacterium]|nr:cytochrome c [Terriglobales bacterium]
MIPTRLSLALLITAALGSSALATRARAQGAEDLYLHKCAICHGNDGAAHTMKGRKLKVKDLRSAEVQKLTDAQITQVIAKGKAPNMDGFADDFTPAQIADLVKFVRSLAKP